MLREKYTAAQKTKEPEWTDLDRFFKQMPWSSSAFISTNWDTVIEEKLEEVQDVSSFEYGCGAVAATLHPEGLKRRPCDENSARVVKLHGSVNWLYCDSCRGTFSFPAKESNKVAGQLLRERDWAIITGQRTTWTAPYLCIRCGADALGTRLATFSFEKALDFPMFQKSWFAAECLLRRARTWVFIGYSLPAADFEFKFLLKRIQLSRKQKPDFVLISKGEYADDTFDHYQHFFGRGFRREENFFADGITEVAIAHILSRRLA
jgi:NAD-dependent SIR2 family protein deacetylase